MGSFWLAAASALWLGILTSISPCPLATNIAAISYIGRRLGNSRQVFLTGLLYTLGRTAAYLVLGVLLVASVLSIPQLSMFLQKYMNQVLGPVLILVAMFLLGMIRVGFSGGGVSDKMQRRVDAWGIWGAGLLGIVFALSFCPVSAALFFGSLIPLSIKYGSSIIMPSVYGIGTAVPVIVFAILIALSAQSVGKAFNRLTQVEWWARRLTGGIFLAVGIHYCLKYIFEIAPFWDPWLESLCKTIW
jgi:cytochrome c biogenesis protein CcdA